MIAAGVRLKHARIDGEALALDQICGHAGSHHAFEEVAQHIAVAEATVAVLREDRVIRHLVVKIEAAEPPVGKVERDLLGEPALRADAVAVADDEHPDQELGIDRGLAGMAVIGSELTVQIGKGDRHEDVHPAQQMAMSQHDWQTEPGRLPYCRRPSSCPRVSTEAPELLKKQRAGEQRECIRRINLSCARVVGKGPLNVAFLEVGFPSVIIDIPALTITRLDRDRPLPDRAYKSQRFPAGA